VFEEIAPFSGGEKARLALALVAYTRPNLLLLDEPTNHLDLEMRQALAMALQEYAGAVVLVSHDRHLLTTVSDRFLLVSDGRVREFDGDLDDYARWLASGDTSAQAAPVAPKSAPAKQAATPKPTASKPATKADAQQRRRETADQRQATAPLRSRLARCEKRLSELSVEAKRLDAELAAPGTYTPGQARHLQDLTVQRARVAQETESVETEWLQLTDELERAASASDG